MNISEKNEKPPQFEDLSTRLRLAEILGVTSRSIANYHSLALSCVDDYFDDFPRILGQRITNFRLSKYQCWVIWKLKLAIDISKNSKVIKLALIDDLESQKLFSKEQFKLEYLGESNNESQGICLSK